MFLSQNDSYSNDNFITIKYKFIKFDCDSGSKLLVIRNIRYFAECAIFSKNLQPSQIETIHLAMKEWEKITNIKFIYEENEPNLFISASDLDFFNTNETKEILGAGWEINFKKQQVIFIDYKAGHSYHENSMWILLHELGHVPFSLKHIPEYPAHIAQNFDNSLASVMSYRHVHNSFNKIIYPVTPSQFDISLVQEKFGVNKIYTAGDDIYKFSPQTKGHYTLYDSGGEDTIDLSSFNENLNITLNSGLSNINNISPIFSFSIYKSSTIEHIITGKGNDIICGNDASNKINPGAGNNIIYGGMDKDYFIFNKKNPGINIIKDFTLAQDKIVLEGFSLSCSNFAQIVSIHNSQIFIRPATHTTIELTGECNLLTCDDIIFQ